MDKGQIVIMLVANYYPCKNTYGEIINCLPENNIEVKWEDGSISIVMEHWVNVV